MDYVDFGRTGIKVSPLALGCMLFGDKADAEQSYRIVDRAIDAGINIFDTANIYNAGRSEVLTGEALARNGKRDRVILCTKVHGVMDSSDPNSGGVSRHHLISECEASLRRLKTDRIDLYQLHRPVSGTAIDETLRTLDDLVRAGKVRYLGTSTFAAWQVVESLWCSKELHLNRFVSEQPPYNLLDRRIERELVPMCRTFGIAIMPWSPIAGGLLSGKYRLNQPIPVGTRFFDKESNPLRASRWTEASLQLVEKLLPLAQPRNLTLAQYSLAWVRQQPGVTSTIIGPRTVEQLETYLSTSELRFTPEELKMIDELVPPGSKTSPYYELESVPHVHRW